jgi:hypothetical protein
MQGSVAFKLAKALEFSGFRTGLFVSPHVSCFRERMQVNGKLISEDDVIRHLTKVYTYTYAYIYNLSCYIASHALGSHMYKVLSLRRITVLCLYTAPAYG